jgi:hypothetical protein
VEQQLKSVCDNVGQWLRFAEGKNAALVAFNSAVSFGVIKILSESAGLALWVRWYLTVAIVLLCLGTVASLFSFSPQLRLPWIFPRSRTDARDNLLYFGHIAAYTPEAYIEAFAHSVTAQAKEPTHVERMYAEQIIMNSQIALSKYYWFLAALWLTLAAFATPIAPVVGLVIWLWKRKERR